MITDKGKSIIGKYLLGQTSAYASYIAIGSGAQPLQTDDPYGDYSEKQNLDFEMIRVPISSKGFVNDGGIEKLVLTAELPTEERYEISEIGIFSAGSNPSAGSSDSKTVFAFTQGENWQYHDQSSVSVIPTILDALDKPNNDNIIATTDPAFQTNANNSIFFNTDRASRYERCRFLNNVIFVVGDDADLTIDSSTGSSAGHFVIEPGSNHIHLTGTTVDFSKNAPTDEIKLAFSLVSKTGASSLVPDTVRILIEFAAIDVENSGEFARLEIELENGSGTGGTYDFSQNRYFIITEQLQNLYTTTNFTWEGVSVVKIYTSIIESDSPTSEYYIAYDAVRLENVSTVNPIYGMTGYSVIKNPNAETIIKNPNTSNYIEFRFTVGVS
jgi:hypothetical protein